MTRAILILQKFLQRTLNKTVNEYQFDKSSFQQDLDAIYKSVVAEKEKFPTTV